MSDFDFDLLDIDDDLLDLLEVADFDHAQKYLADLTAWSRALHTPRVAESLDSIERELNNINDAFQRVSDGKGETELRLVRDYAIALFDYFDKRSRWADWLPYGVRGRNACEKLDDETSRQRSLPTLRNQTGIAYRMGGQRREALAEFAEALRETTDPGIAADAHINLCDIYRLQKDLDQAKAHAADSLKLAREAGDKNREAKALEYQGLSFLAEYDYAQAIGCYERALGLRREVGNVSRMAMVYTQLAYALSLRGDPADLERALELYKQSAKIDIQLENWQAVARFWGDIAVTYNRLGRYQNAIENSELALHRNREIGFLRGAGLNCIRLTESYWRLGDYEKALGYARQALEDMDRIEAFDWAMTAASFCASLKALLPHAEPSLAQQLSSFLESRCAS